MVPYYYITGYQNFLRTNLIHKQVFHRAVLHGKYFNDLYLGNLRQQLIVVMNYPQVNLFENKRV